MCLFWTHQKDFLIGLPASSLFPFASALVLLDECSAESSMSHTCHFTFPSRHSESEKHVKLILMSSITWYSQNISTCDNYKDY